MKQRMPLRRPLHLGHRSLPTSLASLKALHVLKLSNQQLTGTLPDANSAGGAFSALEELDVSYNRLNGRLPLLPGAVAHSCPNANRPLYHGHNTCLCCAHFIQEKFNNA